MKQSLVGRKIIGFKFQEKNEFHWWREEMEKYIGVVGQITGVSMDCIDVVVKFPNDDTIYRYPFELINKHLVNDDKIKPKKSTKDRILSETSEETLEEVAKRRHRELSTAEVGIIPNFVDGFVEGYGSAQQQMYNELVDLLESLRPIYREDSDFYQKYDKQRLNFIEQLKKNNV